ncbi:uncharacterized protein LOC108582346 [Papio anubis]|uniref:uncharacterized protein LOC108582346 n=1 Tax=Papio anubis TaxID=9555 RepID=UPI0012AD337A|nr:uncharacterized protein LOC108582346 [Papio anubis]
MSTFWICKILLSLELGFGKTTLKGLWFEKGGRGVKWNGPWYIFVTRRQDSETEGIVTKKVGVRSGGGASHSPATAPAGTVTYWKLKRNNLLVQLDNLNRTEGAEQPVRRGPRNPTPDRVGNARARARATADQKSPAYATELGASGSDSSGRTSLVQGCWRAGRRGAQGLRLRFFCSRLHPSRSVYTHMDNITITKPRIGAQGIFRPRTGWISCSHPD